jgi:hypothetical protein
VNCRLFLTVSLFSLAILFLPFLLPKALAKTKPSKAPSSTQKHVFETKIDLGLFGLLGGGMNYSLNGKKIIHYRDFNEIINSLHDEESTKLIRESESADLASWILLMTGIPVGIDVALAFKPVPLLGIDWTDRISTGFVAAQAFIALGAIFETNAASLKYNAVQRYNHLVRGEEIGNLSVTPRLFVDGGHLGLGFIGRF